MRRMFMLAVLSQLVAPAIAGPVVVETATGAADELAVAATVQRLIDEHDISDWMFTDRIVVDRDTRIPHSHPVLTLNINYRDDDNDILGDVIHEQMHWFLLADQSALGAAIREMRERYPNSPDGPPAGARDLDSTFLHLVVCSLEYLALEHKIGRAATEKQILSKPYYTWVFKTVVDDREFLREILLGNGIVLP